jgi:nucleotide-binding universal stress UspA family protein
MERILIATDLSTMKREVIRAGFELARKTNSAIDLLAVVNRSLDFFPPDTGIVFADQWQARQFLAQRELEGIREQNPDLNIEVTTIIGNPLEEIIEQSIERRSSYIVIGTHGRTGLSQVLLGSTAEYIIRHATVPVLVVPLNKLRH